MKKFASLFLSNSSKLTSNGAPNNNGSDNMSASLQYLPLQVTSNSSSSSSAVEPMRAEPKRAAAVFRAFLPNQYHIIVEFLYDGDFEALLKDNKLSTVGIHSAFCAAWKQAFAGNVIVGPLFKNHFDKQDYELAENWKNKGFIYNSSKHEWILSIHIVGVEKLDIKFQTPIKKDDQDIVITGNDKSAYIHRVESYRFAQEWEKRKWALKNPTGAMLSDDDIIKTLTSRHTRLKVLLQNSQTFEEKIKASVENDGCFPEAVKAFLTDSKSENQKQLELLLVITQDENKALTTMKAAVWVELAKKNGTGKQYYADIEAFLRKISFDTMRHSVIVFALFEHLLPFIAYHSENSELYKIMGAWAAQYQQESLGNTFDSAKVVRQREYLMSEDSRQQILTGDPSLPKTAEVIGKQYFPSHVENAFNLCSELVGAQAVLANQGSDEQQTISYKEDKGSVISSLDNGFTLALPFSDFQHWVSMQNLAAAKAKLSQMPPDPNAGLASCFNPLILDGEITAWAGSLKLSVEEQVALQVSSWVIEYRKTTDKQKFDTNIDNFFNCNKKFDQQDALTRCVLECIYRSASNADRDSLLEAVKPSGTTYSQEEPISMGKDGHAYVDVYYNLIFSEGSHVAQYLTTDLKASGRMLEVLKHSGLLLSDRSKDKSLIQRRHVLVEVLFQDLRERIEHQLDKEYVAHIPTVILQHVAKAAYHHYTATIREHGFLHINSFIEDDRANVASSSGVNNDTRKQKGKKPVAKRAAAVAAAEDDHTLSTSAAPTASSSKVSDASSSASSAAYSESDAEVAPAVEQAGETSSDVNSGSSSAGWRSIVSSLNRRATAAVTSAVAAAKAPRPAVSVNFSMQSMQGSLAVYKMRSSGEPANPTVEEEKEERQQGDTSQSGDASTISDNSNVQPPTYLPVVIPAKQPKKEETAEEKEQKERDARQTQFTAVSAKISDRYRILKILINSHALDFKKLKSMLRQLEAAEQFIEAIHGQEDACVNDQALLDAFVRNCALHTLHVQCAHDFITQHVRKRESYDNPLKSALDYTWLPLKVTEEGKGRWENIYQMLVIQRDAADSTWKAQAWYEWIWFLTSPGVKKAEETLKTTARELTIWNMVVGNNNPGFTGFKSKEEFSKIYGDKEQLKHILTDLQTYHQSLWFFQWTQKTLCIEAEKRLENQIAYLHLVEKINDINDVPSEVGRADNILRLSQDLGNNTSLAFKAFTVFTNVFNGLKEALQIFLGISELKKELEKDWQNRIEAVQSGNSAATHPDSALYPDSRASLRDEQLLQQLAEQAARMEQSGPLLKPLPEQRSFKHVSAQPGPMPAANAPVTNVLSFMRPSTTAASALKQPVAAQSNK